MYYKATFEMIEGRIIYPFDESELNKPFYDFENNIVLFESDNILNDITQMTEEEFIVERDAIIYLKRKQEDDFLKQQILSDAKNRLIESQLTAKEKYVILDKESATISELKTAKIEVLKEDCTQEIFDGFISESTGYEFGYDNWDQGNFTKQMVLLLSGDTSDIFWKTKNAGIVKLTVDQFQSVISEAKTHQMEQQAKYWQLEDIVLKATTKEEVDVVTW